jgi:hypothetical protein
LQVLLIDPRQAQRVPGRPTTDRLDGTWLQRWHTYGLLAGALRPDAHVCVLRSSLRHRQMLLTSAAHHIQHRHKALGDFLKRLSLVVIHDSVDELLTFPQRGEVGGGNTWTVSSPTHRRLRDHPPPGLPPLGEGHTPPHGV